MVNLLCICTRLKLIVCHTLQTVISHDQAKLGTFQDLAPCCSRICI